MPSPRGRVGRPEWPAGRPASSAPSARSLLLRRLPAWLAYCQAWPARARTTIRIWRQFLPKTRFRVVPCENVRAKTYEGAQECCEDIQFHGSISFSVCNLCCFCPLTRPKNSYLFIALCILLLDRRICYSQNLSLTMMSMACATNKLEGDIQSRARQQ